LLSTIWSTLHRIETALDFSFGIPYRMSIAMRKRLLQFALAMIVSCCVWVTPGLTQSQAGSALGDAAAFEIASVRPDDPNQMFRMVYSKFSGDGYRASHVTVQGLLKDAFDLDDSRILGAPGWVRTTQYEIEARIDTNTALALGKMNEEQQKIAHRRMLTTLLADRYHLAVHLETRNLPTYELVVAKGGSKLHEAKAGDDYSHGLKTWRGETVGPHMMQMQLHAGKIRALGGQGVPLDVLVNQLTAQVGRTVVDKTGLSGNYDFNLKWSTIGAESSDDADASLFTALEEQLGLKLEARKGPVPVVVVDRVEAPTEN
jgi:uncharacterized protein (TIGR03435 family)